MKNKKKIVFLSVVIISIFLMVLTYSSITKQGYPDITFGGMYIEEKGHLVVPGEYQKMWIIGYNAYEKSENRDTYKVFIKDANVYNIIEENQEYIVTFSAKSKDDAGDYIYSLDWISLPDGGQISGDGLIDRK
ncbi:hypothetical protein [Paucisalibacillus globulus]|uniref:hypothetical protein n=1 Tax=Paucisalibacillus globulus TaxID=351095 RepID=UPI000BB86D8A|nr:hypothetical protein [Paucisalibacillus globulus]